MDMAIGPHVNLEELLQHKIGKRVALEIGGSEVTVQPVASLAEQIYRKWVEDNRAYVRKSAAGGLDTYTCATCRQALKRLFLDLDAQNRTRRRGGDDIRNNNGGFVNVYAIDVLARRPI